MCYSSYVTLQALSCLEMKLRKPWYCEPHLKLYTINHAFKDERIDTNVKLLSEKNLVILVIRVIPILIFVVKFYHLNVAMALNYCHKRKACMKFH